MVKKPPGSSRPGLAGRLDGQTSQRRIGWNGAAVHLAEMGHHIEQSQPIILEEIVLVPFQLELLGEAINEIHVNLNSFSNG